MTPDEMAVGRLLQGSGHSLESQSAPPPLPWKVAGPRLRWQVFSSHESVLTDWPQLCMNKNFGLCGLGQEECGDGLAMPAKGAEPAAASVPGVLHAPSPSAEENS